MEYRSTSATEMGFENDDDEIDAMRNFIQTMMRKSGPADLLDSVLVVVNICEQRALVYGEHPYLHAWYTDTGNILRAALDMIAPNGKPFCPQQKLENPILYFPDVDHQH